MALNLRVSLSDNCRINLPLNFISSATVFSPPWMWQTAALENGKAHPHARKTQSEMIIHLSLRIHSLFYDLFIQFFFLFFLRCRVCAGCFDVLILNGFGLRYKQLGNNLIQALRIWRLYLFGCVKCLCQRLVLCARPIICAEFGMLNGGDGLGWGDVYCLW